MPGKFKIVLLFIIISALVISIVVRNAFKIQRDFALYYNTNLGFCFLIDDGYQLEFFDKSFIYRGGKNRGDMQLVKADLSSDIIKVNINGFDSGYKKLKNFRIYEYRLLKGYILRDNFEIVQRMPVNLVPYKKEACDRIKLKFKKHIKIFKGV